MMLLPLPLSIPLSQIRSKLLDQREVEMYVLALDKTDSVISGNKWFKLRLNLEEAKKRGAKRVITFGGAFSNHIHACAKACELAGLPLTGIIRGEEHLPLNQTLLDAKAWGMEIVYVSRTLYRKKNEPEFLKLIEEKWGPDCYIVPEGGSNALGVVGACEINRYIPDFATHACLSIGSGGTIAGLALGARKNLRIRGYAAIKGGYELPTEIKKLQLSTGLTENGIIDFVYDFHFGGFGKTNQTLKDFMRNFEQENGILLDPVYTGKLFFGIIKEIEMGLFEKGSKIIAIHTGGLQGRIL